MPPGEGCNLKREERAEDAGVYRGCEQVDHGSAVPCTSVPPVQEIPTEKQRDPDE
jgi:hypothetical protein